MTRQRDSHLSESIKEAMQANNNGKLPAQQPNPAPPPFPKNAKQDTSKASANKEAEYDHHHHMTIDMHPGKPPPAADHSGRGGPVKEKTPPPSPLKKSPVIDFASVVGFASIARDIDTGYEVVKEEEDDDDDDDEGLYMADCSSEPQEKPKLRGSASSAATGGAVEVMGSAGKVTDRREARGRNG